MNAAGQPRRPGVARSSTGGDRYAALVSSGMGAQLAAWLGLPRPVTLRRYAQDEPLVPTGDVAGVVAVVGETALAARILNRLAELDIDATGAVKTAEGEPAETRLAAVVVDVSQARRILDLDGLRSALQASLRRLVANARVVVIGTDPATLTVPEEVATQRALEGLVRSLGKELRNGATANLVLLRSPEADPLPTVEFFLSGRSAYVDGQVLRIVAAQPILPAEPARPLAGKVAVVTGAARGIGASIVAAMARDGARIIAVDVPAAGQALADVANAAGGVALQVDITNPHAGHLIGESAARLGGLDIVVHNAGITRDKLLANMDPSKWAAVMEVNLAAQVRLNDALLADGGPLNPQARVIAVSSMSGIAGNRGQTNYAASKAGVIGLVQAYAQRFDGSGNIYNAVAPGFIETEMTARMPLGPRELGRRLNSLSQGGLPRDVAEVVAFFAQPSSAGLNGQVLRVCGQSMLGA